MAIRPGGDGNTYSAYVPSNSAEEVLNGPAEVYTGYDFGDWITGRSAQKQAAANQANLDYAEYYSYILPNHVVV